MIPSYVTRAGRRTLALLCSTAMWLGLSAAPALGSVAITNLTGDLDSADTSSGSVEEALSAVTDAFFAFDRAAAPLVDGADESELSGVLAARELLLDAAMGLQMAVAAAPPTTPVAIPPGPCAFDLVGVANTYTVDCRLLIDVGGDDTYANNAGGVNGGAAALIDLSGNDVYGGTRQLGANGGGVLGAGFLFDGRGHDAYSAGNTGTNGGGYLFGLGFLLDAGGNDRYTAANCATNGGGCSLGSGTLIDLGGTDAYSAGRFGANGGSDSGGRGLLIDGGKGGADTYSDLETCAGSGTDRTVAPKGVLGAQVDSTNPEPDGACLPTPPNPPPLPAVGSVTGRVTDAQTKAGIAGAIVDCGGLQTAAPTLVDGSYAIPAVPAGTARCTARAVGYRPKSQDVTVSHGTISGADFALRRDR